MKTRILLLACALAWLGAVGQTPANVQPRPADGLPGETARAVTARTLTPLDGDRVAQPATAQSADAGKVFRLPPDGMVRKAAARTGEAATQLTVMTEGTVLPDSFRQWETGSFTVRLQNTGTTDLSADLAWFLLGLEADTIAYMDGTYQSWNFRAGVPVDMSFSYSMGEAAPGTYRLAICSIELVEVDGGLQLGGYTPLPFEGGGTSKTVEVLAYEQPLLSFDQTSVTFPATHPGNTTPSCFLWGGEYTLRPILANTGGDYDGLLYAALLRRNAQGSLDIYHLSTPVPATLAKGETRRFAFSGTVETSLPVGAYYFVLLTEDYQLIGTTEGYMLNTHVIYPLTLQAEGSTVPASMRQNEDAIVTLRLSNLAMTDIDDYIYMYMENADNSVSQMGWVQAFVPALGTTVIAIPYNLGDREPGEQVLTFGYLGSQAYGTGNLAYTIGWDDGTVSRTVQVVANEAPALTWLAAQSTLPVELTMHETFSAPLTLTNTGADFSGEVYLILYGSDYLIQYRSEATQVSVPRGDTVQITLAGTVDLPTELPRPVAYYMDVAYDTNSGVTTVPSDDGQQRIITIHPDPATSPVLTWLTEQTELPATFTAGEGYYLTIPVRNTGQAAYTGDVALTFLDGNTYERMFYYRLSTTIAGQSTEQIPYSIMLPADMEAGTYALQMNLMEDNSIVTFVPTESRGYYLYPITVESPTTGLSQAAAGSTLYPNPATDYVVVTDGAGIGRLRLYSPDGALVLDEPCDGRTMHRLDLGTLPPGVYLLAVTTPDGTRTERVVKR